jgi:CheY-like chemotaxis protein
MKTLKKILLAEDDIEDREIIEDAFVSIGAAGIAHYVWNGEEVLALLENWYKQDILPCLIILDLNMPRLSGAQTLRIIKKDERFRQIPTYIYSTSLNPIEKENCLQLGAQDYIIKPVTYDESLKTARKFIQHCESRNIA